MPRTGTTFLQRKVFPKLPKYHFYGIPFTHYNHHFQQMMYMDESLFNQQSFNEFVKSLPGNHKIMSNENFIGQSLFFYHSNRTRTAERLQKAFPEATILLYIRNQLDLLKSLYLITLGWKETKSVEDFIWTKRKDYTLEQYLNKEYNYGENDAYYATFESHEHLDGYLFLPLIELYKSLFENVHVILYESFEEDPLAVAKQLENILEVTFDETILQAFKNRPKLNKSASATQAKWLSKINKWYTPSNNKALNERIIRNLKKFVLNNLNSDETFELPEDLQKTIIQFYKENNKQLNEKFPEIGLNKFKTEYFL
jgi:hypothetical protein